MTLPVPNMQAALVYVRGGFGFLAPPWNSFFQQFVQPAPAVASVISSPFTANANGTVIITGAATITLTRGLIAIALAATSEVIPVSIGDTVSWTGGATVQFLGA